MCESKACENCTWCGTATPKAPNAPVYEVDQIVGEAIKRYEEYFDINIILASEAGSRAWGFPSPDSDYDVRFIYVRNTLDSYVGLDAKNIPDTLGGYPNIEAINSTKSLSDADKEFYTEMLDLPIDLDMAGWDIRKAVSLLMKGNATVHEWVNSPIRYYEGTFSENLRELSKTHGPREVTLRAYSHTAAHTYDDIYSRHQFSIKKYLYALRFWLAAEYLVKNPTAESAPVPFRELLPLLTDSDEVAAVERLLARKKATLETEDAQTLLESYQYRSILYRFHARHEAREALGHQALGNQDLAAPNQLIRMYLPKY